jgi:hypothetical protein
MLSGARDMLGDFGQEIQGIEHLEIARGAGGQFLVPRFGEAAHCGKEAIWRQAFPKRWPGKR